MIKMLKVTDAKVSNSVYSAQEIEIPKKDLAESKNCDHCYSCCNESGIMKQ